MLEEEHPARVSIITDRTGNPYRPRSKLWRLYQEDFSGWSAYEIADQLGSTVDSVWALMRKVYKDTGYDVPYRHSPGHERGREPWKPREPKKPKRTMTEALRSEDFSDLNAAEIAEIFDTTERGVWCAMAKIYRETGYRVPYVHREAGRRRGK